MNLRTFKIAKQIFAAITQTDSEQYEKAMYDFYDNKRFVDFTLQQDYMAERMFKQRYPESQTKTLTNGNTFLKYIETKDKIIILALLSKNGKLTKEDLRDAISQLNFMLDKLYQGKTIETSCNNKSLPLLKRLQKMQPRVKINKVHDFGNIMGVGQWSHYIVTI